jgi:PAS domain S-box-containing protein
MNNERRIAEEALRESEQRWRSLTEALPQLVWSATPDGACDYFSTQWTEYTGVAESELLGWRWMDVLHFDDRQSIRQFWTDSVAGRRPYDVEYRVRRHDGTYGWFKTRGVPIRDSNGDIVKWFGSCTDITDGKRAEEALRESEQRWRILTEALPQLVWSATPDGANDYVSTQWTEYTGVAESELLGWRWMDVLHPDDRQSIRQFWTDSVAGRRPYDVEYRVRRHDGTYGWFKTRGVPIRDSNGDIVKWFGSCTDITDGKRAEEALRQREQELRKARDELEKKVAERTAELRRSEAYLAEAQRLTRTGSWALTVATREIVHLSDQFYQIFGFDPERGMPSQQTIRQCVHPEDRPTSVEIVDKAIREGRGYELDHRIVLPEGTIKFIHVVARPVFNTSGDLVEFVGTVMDVTERKRAEEALRESESYLAEAQRIAHVGHWDHDLDTDRYHFSDEAYRIFGLRPQEKSITSAVAQELIHPEDWESTTQARMSALRGGPPYDVEYRVVWPNGEVRVVHGRGDVTRDESGRPRRRFGTVQDITERKRAEEDLRESERRYREAQMELAHVNRVTTMGLLTASIAHEVNQPIAAAVTNADAGLRWLAAQPPDLEEVRDAFDHIIKASNQASEVIGRIRALIKKVPARKANLDINETILETIALTRSEMRRHCILLQTELANGLPRIWGDRVQLQQVILNLIMNAIEAMSEVSEGSRALLIGTGVDTPDSVIVAVRDSGPGLKPESLDHLFDPFYTTKPTGMGMGLSICRSITEAHGGRLWATANAPRGAVFQFTLHQDDAS